MSQLTFKFPFKTSYFEKDFFVSENNFAVYRLIESWPNWPDKKINIFGPSGCGKTHLAFILSKKIDSIMIKADEIQEDFIEKVKNKNCLIIDSYKNNIEEKLFYTILNEAHQSNQYVVINSFFPIKKNKIKLIDLQSRLSSFIDLGIDLPTDDLLRVIIIKSFSDMQIEVNMKILEYILKNIDRSYEKIFKFIKDIDLISLSTGKAININLIKKVLKNE
jgi:chromosomal replication initiation ATPase DnaA